jgi:spore cortex biosynthesis protein YabQ
MVSVEQQTIMFLVSIFGGVVIRFVYDIFKAVRHILKNNKQVTYISDILFWILAAILVFYFLNLSCNGEVRGFLILGFIIGAGLYYFMIGDKFVNLICKIVMISVKIILKPVLFLLKPIYKFVRNIVKKLLNKIRLKKEK